MSTKVVFIIPARAGSRRLNGKNLYMLLGRPLISYAIESCKKSQHYDGQNLVVSTEDEKIKNVATSYGASVIDRPEKLSADDVWTQDVLKHAMASLEGIDADIVVRVQANSPQVSGAKIDQCIEKLVKKKLWEVFTVDQDGIEDAAIHVMLRRCVEQQALSVYKGVVETNYIDIHTIEDVELAKSLMLCNGAKDAV